ncbi:class III lanthionine synthetase LanKC N-terminal domain-containing protein [Streptomyces sp. NPDC003016]
MVFRAGQLRDRRTQTSLQRYRSGPLIAPAPYARPYARHVPVQELTGTRNGRGPGGQAPRAPTASWTRSERDNWVVLRPDGGTLPLQGWKLFLDEKDTDHWRSLLSDLPRGESSPLVPVNAVRHAPGP